MVIETTKVLLASGLRDLILFELGHSVNTEESYCFYDCYQNGREQGFTIYVKVKAEKYKTVTLTECRNSDSIIVYLENDAIQGLSEEAYENAKFFNPGEYSKVVEFCVNYLLGK
jgi:hypothetical protein